MFLGHFAVALALKRAEPRISLGTLCVAAEWVDIMWAIFLLLGLEHVEIAPGLLPACPLDFIDYPLTHSLVAGMIWAGLFGAAYYSWPTPDTSRHLKRTIAVMVAVWSHWFLDVVVHTPDLPVFGNDSTKLGLGLWRNLPATIILETVLLAAGVYILLRKPSRQHPPRPGRILLFAGVLYVLYLASLFGPPPPSVPALAATILVGSLFIFGLAVWADRPLKVEPQPRKP